MIHFRSLPLNKYLKLLVSFSCLLATVSLAGGEKAEPLLPSTVVKSKLSSVTDAVEKMWGTEAYSSPDAEHYQTGVENVTDIEKAAIKDFVEKNSGGHIYIVRYGLSDAELVEILKKAIAKGFNITLIVDLNRALEGEEGAPKSGSSNFDTLKENENEMSRSIDALLAAGCKYKVGKCRILSQPVFKVDGDEMISILHDKATVLVKNEGTPAQEMEYYTGTANFSDVTRINTLMKVRDELAKKYYYDLIQAMVKTYEKGGGIRDLPKIPPLRIEYADGSFMELASTLGRYNTNDRIQQLFARAATDAAFQIDDVYMNHFVITHRPSVESLVEAMKVQKNFRVRGLVDDQFIKQDGQGLAEVLSGWDVFRKWGGPLSGYGYDIASRVDFSVYQAPAKDLKTGKFIDETDPELGHLEKKLQHNKTTVVFVTENGKKWAYVFFGSFNLSGHFQNSEFQMMLKVPAESFIAQHARWDYENIKKTQPDYALPMAKAVVRNFLMDFADQDRKNVSMEDVSRGEQAILKRNYADLFALIREIFERKTTIVRRKTRADLDAKIGRMEKYLDWYAKNTQPSQLGDFYRLKKFEALMFIEEHLEMDGWNLEKALRGALWRPNIDPAELDRLVTESWSLLGFPGQPNFLARRAKAEATAREMPALSVGMSWIFDWDDNIAFMPTKIYLFHKTTGEEIAISTQEYAEIRDSLKAGTGKYADYELRNDKLKGSFRRFEESIGGNYFLEDLETLVEGADFEKRKGPVWDKMIEALSNEYSAKQFFILTARSNPREEIYEGLKYLQKKGIIKYLPPIENIYSAQNPADPSGAKARTFVEHMDRQSKTIVSDKAPEVVDRDGIKKVRTHLVGYSDDDWGNFEAILKAAVAGVKAGKWRNVKIVLKYTGRDPKGADMRSVVITSDGTIRQAAPGENDSFRTMLMGCESKLAS